MGNVRFVVLYEGYKLLNIYCIHFVVSRFHVNFKFEFPLIIGLALIAKAFKVYDKFRLPKNRIMSILKKMKYGYTSRVVEGFEFKLARFK